MPTIALRRTRARYFFNQVCAFLTANLILLLPVHGQTSDVQSSQFVDNANHFFWRGEYAQAKEELLKAPISQFTGREPRYLINLAICESQMDNWLVAEKEAKRALWLLGKQQDASLLDISDAESTLAHCLVVEGNIDAAREHFVKSFAAGTKQLGEWNVDGAAIYEGLAACDYVQKRFAESEPLYRKVAELDYLKYGPDDTHLAWSFVSLSDVYSRLGKTELAHELYKKVFWNFRKWNVDLILSQLKEHPDQSQHLSEEQLKENLQQDIFGFRNSIANQNCGIDWLKSQIPEVANGSTCRVKDFNNWFRQRDGREEAPGLVVIDPSIPLKCLVVCIHGLSLNHNAFSQFAHNISKSGIGVISFDIRGFGSYRNDPAYQRIDFDAIINDIKRILANLRPDYPDIPIYLLGESMGGAIALRVGAVAPNLVDGIVSSVPAGDRYRSSQTDLYVAWRLLTKPNKQFNIGSRIVDQATQKPSLREEWQNDPRTRLQLSAVELLKFNQFMRENIKFAHQLKQRPTIIYQGYSDKLVKPTGTFDLYRAIASKDKDLVIVGHAEHLIFEEGQYDPSVVNGLKGWISYHNALREQAGRAGHTAQAEVKSQ